MTLFISCPSISLKFPLHSVDSTTTILVTGGSDNDATTLYTVEAIKIDGTGDVKQCAFTPLPTPLKEHNVGFLMGNILICGGWDGSKFVKTCSERLANTNTWQPAASMTELRGYGARMTVAPEFGAIMTGGIESQNTAEKYKNGKWTPLNNLPMDIRFHCITNIGHDQLLMIGGEQYDEVR